MQARIRHISTFILILPLLAILFHSFFPHQHSNIFSADSANHAVCNCTDSHDDCCKDGAEECEHCLAGKPQSEEKCNLLDLFLKISFTNDIVFSQSLKLPSYISLAITKYYTSSFIHINRNIAESFHLRGPPHLC